MALKILARSKKSWARTGILKTLHGTIETPAFVPVATQGALKGLMSREADELNTQILMVNTYHMWVRGMDSVIKKFGGLHKFMNWQKPLMTDSGGFQVFSLGWAYGKSVGKISKGQEDTVTSGQPKLATIDEDGVSFKSHLDGSVKRLTPKLSIQIQERLGADIIFAFDECTSPLADHDYTKASLEKTHRWAKICLRTKGDNGQLLFGVIQGGRYRDLRQLSAETLGKMDFPGYGIGGGFSKADMQSALGWVIPHLPPQKPRHFLGIGEIEDIKESVKRGIDLFDCVTPTRLARHGVLVTAKGRVTITQAKWRADKNPPEKDCRCYTCQHFSRAYLCHLSRAKEMLAVQLANIHNIYFYNQLMEKIRDDINGGKI